MVVIFEDDVTLLWTLFGGNVDFSTPSSSSMFILERKKIKVKTIAIVSVSPISPFRIILIFFYASLNQLPWTQSLTWIWFIQSDFDIITRSILNQLLCSWNHLFKNHLFQVLVFNFRELFSLISNGAQPALHIYILTYTN